MFSTACAALLFFTVNVAFTDAYRIQHRSAYATKSTLADEAYSNHNSSQTSIGNVDVESADRALVSESQRHDLKARIVCDDGVYNDPKSGLCHDRNGIQLCYFDCETCCQQTPEKAVCPTSGVFNDKTGVCKSLLDSTVVCTGACEDCCITTTTTTTTAITTCGNAPSIPNAYYVNGNVENTLVNESLMYWCDDGYTTSSGTCDESLFENNIDYWLPDDQNIHATPEYNAQFSESWNDKVSDGGTYYWGRVATPKACCDLCLETTDCTSFAYNINPAWNFEPWSGAGYQSCYLKRGFKPGRVRKDGVVSGHPVGTLKVTCGSDGQFYWSGSCKQK